MALYPVVVVFAPPYAILTSMAVVVCDGGAGLDVDVDDQGVNIMATPRARLPRCGRHGQPQIGRVPRP